MVDFNNDATMGKPPKEVVSFIIIEKVYNFLEADEQYAKTILNGAEAFISVPRARLRNLYLVTHTHLPRFLKDKPEALEEIHSVCMDLKRKVNEQELLETFSKICHVLDKMELWKLDTKPKFNRLSVEQSNKAQGFG